MSHDVLVRMAYSWFNVHKAIDTVTDVTIVFKQLETNINQL